jgi:hypothetical protein
VRQRPLEHPVLLQLHVTPFSPTIAPSLLMVAWAIGWGVVEVIGAVMTFHRHPL